MYQQQRADLLRLQATIASIFQSAMNRGTGQFSDAVSAIDRAEQVQQVNASDESGADDDAMRQTEAQMVEIRYCRGRIGDIIGGIESVLQGGALLPALAELRTLRDTTWEGSSVPGTGSSVPGTGSSPAKPLKTAPTNHWCRCRRPRPARCIPRSWGAG
jgi:hypothetical protein